MEKLIEKVENLKRCLDEHEKIQAIKKVNRKIYANHQLLETLEDYQKTPTEDKKKAVLENDLFQEYKKIETDINIIILEINQKLKEINKRGNCTYENN